MLAELTRSAYRNLPLAGDDDQYVSMAADLGRRFAPFAEDHDRENTFVSENMQVIRESGFLRLAVPEELGGFGATMRQVCYAQAELARHCSSTALAINMHHYLVLANVYRWRHGAPVEGLLKRVATENIILMTSGGSDGLYPSTTATRDGDGYLVSGRKVFCSLAPVADVFATMAAYDDPDEGRVVLMMGIPTSSPGFEVLDNWDSMGMRATGSNDVLLDNVRIKDAQVAIRRPWGKVDPALKNAGIHFAPPVASVYFGVAMAARDEAVEIIRGRMERAVGGATSDPIAERQIGLMDSHLRTAWWSLMGALTELGDDYALDDQAFGAVMLAKRQVITSAVEVVDIALATVGGQAYLRTSRLERLFRDVRAGIFHPLNPERTLMHTGRRALDLPVDTIW